MNIEYILFKRSALQFRQDLTDIDESLDSLKDEEALAVVSYIDSIKFKMKILEEKLIQRLAKDENNFVKESAD